MKFHVHNVLNFLLKGVSGGAFFFFVSRVCLLTRGVRNYHHYPNKCNVKILFILYCIP